jgi:hypothetical protein
MRIGTMNARIGVMRALTAALSVCSIPIARICIGDRWAASAPQVLDARRDRNLDVGGFDRDYRRRPHP